MAQKKDSSKPQWKASVTFVPFESEGQRNQAYRTWVKLFLRGEKENDNGERKREIDIALFMCSNQALFW